MKYSKKFYLILGGIGLFLILFELLFKISGFIGLSLCIIGVYLIVGVIIKLLSFTSLIDIKKLEEVDIMRFLWKKYM